jgi:hypothetical protein
VASGANQGNTPPSEESVTVARKDADEERDCERSISMESLTLDVETSAHRPPGQAEHTPAGPSGPSPAGGVFYPSHAGPPSFPIDPDGSNSSTHLLRKFADIPLRVRGRAESWEVPRNQIRMDGEIGRGTGGVVYRAKWRGLECAAKLLSASSQVSIEYFDMINEISVISHLRHPNLVLFLGACTVDEPLLILSEYMTGGSLEEHYNKMRIRLGKPFRPPRQQLYKCVSRIDLYKNEVGPMYSHSKKKRLLHKLKW